MGHEGHDHDHDHPSTVDKRGHEHPSEGDAHKHRARRTLARGAGRGKVLFLDAPSGLAGDMIIATLVDLGVPTEHLVGLWDALPLGGYHVHFSNKERSGIVATSFDVHVEGQQPHRTFASVKELLQKSSLEDGLRARVVHTFDHLAEAEAAVHRTPKDDVHFHEVGAVDAIIDVVGAVGALDYLGAELVVSPLPMGRGFVNAAHGKLPLPPPAVVECLKGFPTYDAGIDFELVTPTGAAIVAANASGASRWPSMSSEHVGWGAGSAELADRPNVLRAVLGAPVQGHRAATHVVLEANLDDATGEMVGAAIETLLRDGALDAWAAPLTMKKGRPGVLLGALCEASSADVIAAVILRETTTIGVRRLEVARTERPRRTLEVETEYGKLPVKISEGPYGPPQIKPEYDACAAAAELHGVPTRVVLAAALVAAAKHL